MQVVAAVPTAGPVPPPHHGGYAGVERLLDLLRADEMDVAVDAAGGDDHAFAGDRLGAGADGDRDAGLDVRIARLADLPDAAVLDPDVGFDDPGMVDDQRVGDDGVGDLRRAALTLSHAVADHFPAAELHLLTVDRVVLLDLDPQRGVGEAHAIADRGAEHLRVGLASDLHLSFPITLPVKPYTLRAPASATSSTVRVWPGSKRTAVPAAMFSRKP